MYTKGEVLVSKYASAAVGYFVLLDLILNTG
jgi:hypothetical protein